MSLGVRWIEKIHKFRLLYEYFANVSRIILQSITVRTFSVPSIAINEPKQMAQLLIEREKEIEWCDDKKKGRIWIEE